LHERKFILDQTGTAPIRFHIESMPGPPKAARQITHKIAETGIGVCSRLTEEQSVTDAAIYRARAEECERLAHTPGYEKERELLLEIAARWRKFAEQTEADDDFSERPEPEKKPSGNGTGRGE
jgi:hypothetical protein